MAITFYDLSVPTFLQTVRAIAAVLRKADEHCARTDADADALVHARLHHDMAPLHFQIESVRNHSVWGLEAIRTGVFAAPPLAGAQRFEELVAMIDEAIIALETFTPAEVNSWSGKALEIDVFRPIDEANAFASAWAPQRLSFTAETYLLSYAFPNFYFHAVTAYDILRTQGVPVGKGDYEGRLRSLLTGQSG
jgi:hypothetical protein